MPQWFQRKKLWVDVESQRPFVLKLIGLWLLGVGIMCGLLFYLVDEELGRSFYSIHVRLRSIWTFLLPAVMISAGVTFLVVMGATIFFALNESHKLGGPIFKFRRLFKQLGEGYIDPAFHFRQGDVLFDLGEAYRVALKNTGEKITEIQILSKKAEGSLQGLREGLASKPLSPSDRQLLDEAIGATERLLDISRSFNVEGGDKTA